MPRFSKSRFSAWLQRIVSRRREASGLYREIAEKLPLEKAGRVLDIGTGTGLQLRAIHELRSTAELYGLDLSPAAVKAAREALSDLEPNLRVGSIADTSYPDNFFDIVTCNASMSYWDKPLDSFNEIYRILRPGGQAVLFEPHREIVIEDALDRIRNNMSEVGPLRRWFAVQLNKFGLERGDRVGMKLYSPRELLDLAQASRFGDRSEVERTSLLNIPIYVCIRLWKSA
jgi:SAM-dependent methyltransferase